MSRRLYTQAFSLILALSLAAYPLGAAIAQALGIQNTPISIATRIVIASLSIILIVKFVSKNRTNYNNKIIILTLFFWFCYFLRIYYDTIVNLTPMFFEPYEYWIWGIGGSFIPMLGLALVIGEERNGFLHFRTLYYMFLVSGVSVALTASTTVDTVYGQDNSGRLNLVALNPISLGNVGASLFLMSFWILFLWKRPRKLLSNVLYAGSGLLGAFLMLASNSRGPLMGLALALVFAFVAMNSSRKFWIVLVTIIAAAAFVPAAILIDQTFNTGIYERLIAQDQFEDGNVLGRYDRYTLAMKSFTDQPFLGTGLEIPEIGGYPHNVVIESFIAVGLFGATAFITLLVILFCKAFIILRSDRGYGWLSLLYVQYVVAAQFSGSIYGSTIMWTIIGALLPLYWPKNQFRFYKNEKQIYFRQ
jgi:hypothetical protein